MKLFLQLAVDNQMQISSLAFNCFYLVSHSIIQLISQSGCCKPSEDCKFIYVSPTNWTSPGLTSSNNTDCTEWSNDPKNLCYNCQACKAGLLDNVKSDWKKVAILNIIILVVLIIVYSVGCCAFRNNREDNAWKRYP